MNTYIYLNTKIRCKKYILPKVIEYKHERGFPWTQEKFFIAKQIKQKSPTTCNRSSRVQFTNFQNWWFMPVRDISVGVGDRSRASPRPPEVLPEPPELRAAPPWGIVSCLALDLRATLPRQMERLCSKFLTAHFPAAALYCVPVIRVFSTRCAILGRSIRLWRICVQVENLKCDK